MQDKSIREEPRLTRRTSEITKIRHIVNTETARLAFAGTLVDRIDDLPKELTDSWVTRYRCCEYKERAILAERIKLTLGITSSDIPEGTRLKHVARRVEEGYRPTGPVISIIDTACDRCPIDTMIVTDACRNCVAHICRNSCPKGAIQIIQNKAYIDQVSCVECGLCANDCPFKAIIKVNRPCERACELGAIKQGQNRNAVIDHDRCVSCGACTAACPFGAITERSQLYHVIKLLQSDAPVTAIVAPSFVGQFGPKVTPGQFKQACLDLGFHNVMEVALGADLVAKEEAKELAERLQAGEPYMTSSCCPAFVELVEKHFPQAQSYVSHTPSPMVRTAEIAKERGAQHVVFIGPCIAKKAEGMRVGPELIDAVLTFEELEALFAAKEINPAEINSDATLTDATHAGRMFAKAGGVTLALQEALAQIPDAPDIQPCAAAGLTECKAALKQAVGGKLAGNMLEGMACSDGCIGGPGAMVTSSAAARKLNEFVKAAK
jgi:ferredoxin hydrogenase large subunit